MRKRQGFDNYLKTLRCSLPDINELTLPKTCATDFPDPDDLLNFKLIICPDEGFYKGGRFVFNFRVGPNYPHEPPKVKCETLVYHPNIDLEGNVCLNILREDWKPVLTINSVVYGLQYLFLVSFDTKYLIDFVIAGLSELSGRCFFGFFLFGRYSVLTFSDF